MTVTVCDVRWTTHVRLMPSRRVCVFAASDVCGCVFAASDVCGCVFAASDVQREIQEMVEAGDEPLPQVRHQNSLREYVGMYEYRKEDEPLLLRNLILGEYTRVRERVRDHVRYM